MTVLQQQKRTFPDGPATDLRIHTHSVATSVHCSKHPLCLHSVRTVKSPLFTHSCRILISPHSDSVMTYRQVCSLFGSREENPRKSRFMTELKTTQLTCCYCGFVTKLKHNCRDAQKITCIRVSYFSSTKFGNLSILSLYIIL